MTAYFPLSSFLKNNNNKGNLVTSFGSQIIADPNTSDQKNWSTSQSPGWEYILCTEDEDTARELTGTLTIISATQLALEYSRTETTGMCMDIT